MDPAPLDDVTESASMDNQRQWMATIRITECNKLSVAVSQNLRG